MHSQKTRGHFLQGRTAQSVVAHMCLSHVKAPSLSIFQDLSVLRPQNGCFFQADRNLHPCWVSKWSRDVSFHKSLRQA